MWDIEGTTIMSVSPVRPGLITQLAAQSAAEDAPPASTTGYKVSPKMTSLVDAAWGAGYGYLMGRVVGTMIGGPRMGAIGAVAGAAWNAQGAWRRGPEHAQKLEDSRSFKNAKDQPVGKSVLYGALGGAALLGGVFGGISALRMGMGSYFMGHSVGTIAGNAFGSRVGQIAAAGLIGGAVLGATSGLMMKDQHTVWGSMKDSFLDAHRAKKDYLWSGAFGALMGVVAYKSSGSIGTAAKAAAVTTATIGSMFYLGTAFRDTMQTGTVTAVAAPHRWND
jgi:hypothetical protein